MPELLAGLRLSSRGRGMLARVLCIRELHDGEDDDEQHRRAHDESGEGSAEVGAVMWSVSGHVTGV
jgi:hypothetical protein